MAKTSISPIFVAVAVGAGVWLWRSKKAKAASAPPTPSTIVPSGDIDISEPEGPPIADPLPDLPDLPGPGPGPGPDPDPDPDPDPEPQPQQKIPAPSFNAGQKSKEKAKVEGIHANWLQAVDAAIDELGEGGVTDDALIRAKEIAGIPKSQKVHENIADFGLEDLYGVSTIPAFGDQGPGWDKFINAWVRMDNRAKKLKWTGA